MGERGEKGALKGYVASSMDARLVEGRKKEWL